MRPIIFRGKRLDNGEWVYGSLVTFNGFHVIVDHHTPNGDEVRVIANTVGQYTGLQDKNGKEIWEGDIVMAETNDEDHPMSELPFVIVFSDGAFCIAEDEESPWAPIDTFMDMEVIGNIHDNPDLLK